MKYLTKEWYKKMQASSLHLLLKIDKRAEEYSEELYKEIYEIEKQKYIKEQSRVNDLLFKITTNFKKNNKKLNYIEKFNNIQKLTIEDLKKKLPHNIINEIKDIRVLALNYSSKKVYDLIKDYSKENEKYVDDKFKEYIKLEKASFKEELNDFFDNSYHDCYIKKVKNSGKNISINFITGGLTEKDTLILENGRIILDENIEECTWLYEEVYKIDNKYELHILAKKGEDLKEMIIECDNIEVK